MYPKQKTSITQTFNKKKLHLFKFEGKMVVLNFVCPNLIPNNVADILYKKNCKNDLIRP